MKLCYYMISIENNLIVQDFFNNEYYYHEKIQLPFINYKFDANAFICARQNQFCYS